MLFIRSTKDLNGKNIQNNQHTIWTLTFAGLWITFTTVLAFALWFACFAMCSDRANVSTQWTSETRCARTFARYVMAFTTIVAAAWFGTIQTIMIARTFEFTLVTSVAFCTFTLAVKLITDTVMFTITFVWAIFTPKAHSATWTKKKEKKKHCRSSQYLYQFYYVDVGTISTYLYHRQDQNNRRNIYNDLGQYIRHACNQCTLACIYFLFDFLRSPLKNVD